MNSLKILLFVILSFFVEFSFAQTQADWEWWGQAHNWDGKTHWSRYIIRTSGFMGPNALPVPLVGNATIGEKIKLETAFEYHKSASEYAYNPYLNLQIPVTKGKVALDFIYRPIEYYKTTEEIGLERFCRRRACEGKDGGDLYIGTLIHVLEQNKHFVDGNLEIYLKTTTGKDLADARHIDAPAYYFDLNLGKTIFNKDGFFRKMSVYGMGGFYAWQVDLNNNRQDDAYLYGLKADFAFKPLTLSCAFSGYTGYLDLGDKPKVFRYAVSKEIKWMQIYFSYQQGLRDMIRNSYRIGLSYNFQIIKNR